MRLKKEMGEREKILLRWFREKRKEKKDWVVGFKNERGEQRKKRKRLVVIFETASLVFVFNSVVYFSKVADLKMASISNI